MIQYLPFEKPIEALGKHTAELSALPEGTEEARMLATRAEALLAETYARRASAAVVDRADMIAVVSALRAWKLDGTWERAIA